MAAMTIPPEVAEARVYARGMDEQEKQKVALWRLSVLGPLVSSRLEHGDYVNRISSPNWMAPRATRRTAFSR